MSTNIAPAGSGLYRILLIDADTALLGLITEWLTVDEFSVIAGESDPEPPAGKFDVVIVDIPFPRNRSQNALTHIRDTYGNIPIIVVSSHFFAGIESAGDIARTLGVSRVLAKPLTREALTAAVHTTLGR